MQSNRVEQGRHFLARKRFRFGLRTLLLAFTIFAMWLGVSVERARKQKRAADRVRELGGWVLYEYQIDDNTGNYFDNSIRYQVSPYGPLWLRELLGPEFFNSPVIINLAGSDVTDEDLVILHNMPSLQSVGLENTRVSDAGLNELTGLKHLTVLYLHRTYVTDKGVAWLREQFPESDIRYSPGHVFTPKEPKMASTIVVGSGSEATRLGVRVNQECVIQLIYPGSPADLAGMKVDDKIIEIESDSVAAPQVLVDLVDRQSFGASLKMGLLRSKEALAVQVILDGASR